MGRRSVILLCTLGLAIGGGGAAWAAFSGSTQNSGNTFSAAQSFNTCPASNPSPTWLTGLEHGVVSTAGGGLFTYVGGSAAADSATKRSGSYALKLAPSAGTVAYAGPATTGTTAVVRFALRSTRCLRRMSHSSRSRTPRRGACCSSAIGPRTRS